VVVPASIVKSVLELEQSEELDEGQELNELEEQKLEELEGHEKLDELEKPEQESELLLELPIVTMGQVSLELSLWQDFLCLVCSFLKQRVLGSQTHFTDQDSLSLHFLPLSLHFLTVISHLPSLHLLGLFVLTLTGAILAEPLCFPYFWTLY
jgi:hypothetical protein